MFPQFINISGVLQYSGITTWTVPQQVTSSYTTNNPIKNYFPIGQQPSAVSNTHLKENSALQVNKEAKELCKFCKRKIPISQWQKHTKQCTNSQSLLFKCHQKQCKQSFKTMEERSAHNYAEHCTPSACPSLQGCNLKVNRSHRLAQHPRDHPTNVAHCPKCNKKCLVDNLAKHVRHCVPHWRSLVPTAPKVPLVTHSVALRNLRQMSPYNGVMADRLQRYHCESCAATFWTSRARMVHIWEAHGRPPVDYVPPIGSGDQSTSVFKCGAEGCREVFPTAWDRVLHVQKAHLGNGVGNYAPIKCGLLGDSEGWRDQRSELPEQQPVIGRIGAGELVNSETTGGIPEKTNVWRPF